MLDGVDVRALLESKMTRSDGWYVDFGFSNQQQQGRRLKVMVSKCRTCEKTKVNSISSRIPTPETGRGEARWMCRLRVIVDEEAVSSRDCRRGKTVVAKTKTIWVAKGGSAVKAARMDSSPGMRL